MRFLVAGVGNIFFGDDGFGPAVIGALGSEPIPHAKVEDFGIRGLHLAYELLAGYDWAILIDAVPRGGAPGTLYVIEPNLDLPGASPDAHSMDLRNVFAFARTLGGEPPPITLVGCEPATADEGIGLSEPVAAAVEPAAQRIRQLLAERVSSQPTPERVTSWSAT